jgi:hypothetical protein
MMQQLKTLKNMFLGFPQILILLILKHVKKYLKKLGQVHFLLVAFHFYKYGLKVLVQVS